MGISKTFAYHAPCQDALQKMEKLRQTFSFMEDQLKALCPPSRERSVALTELEACAMWAMKAITHNDARSGIVLDPLAGSGCGVTLEEGAFDKAAREVGQQRVESGALPEEAHRHPPGTEWARVQQERQVEKAVAERNPRQVKPAPRDFKQGEVLTVEEQQRINEQIRKGEAGRDADGFLLGETLAERAMQVLKEDAARLPVTSPVAAITDREGRPLLGNPVQPSPEKQAAWDLAPVKQRERERDVDVPEAGPPYRVILPPQVDGCCAKPSGKNLGYCSRPPGHKGECGGFIPAEDQGDEDGSSSVG